jgi:hypothetical protein
MNEDIMGVMETFLFWLTLGLMVGGMIAGVYLLNVGASKLPKTEDEPLDRSW